MKRVTRPTNLVQEQIVASIRSGGYPLVAAEAWDVSRPQFESWMTLGEQPRAREPYRTFAAQVRQALAQARLKAEIETFENDPKMWLERGPGRETPERPGWSQAVKAADADRVVGEMEWARAMEIFRWIAEVLEPFPEARQAVSNRAEEHPRSATQRPVGPERRSGFQFPCASTASTEKT